MSSEWRSVSLGQCAELDLGYPFKSADYTDSEDDTRLLRGDNIGQGQLRWDGVRRWLRREDDKLASYELRENDLVLAMDRPWIAAGLKFARVRTSDLPSLLVQRVARLRPKEGVDADYLHSVIASADFTQHIQTITTGTAVPHISGKQIQEYKFNIPGIATQRAIGSLLIGFDDRITLLRETNATLEAIAQALFKSWFVDFDPVRAKMQGRAPEGMDEATAALFPDAFEESALGLVPRGWRLGTLQDLLLLQRGFDLPSDGRVPGDFPIIAASGPSGTHNISMAKAPGVVTGRSGILGRVFLELDDYWPLNTTLWVREFRAASPCYAYELLRLLDLKSFNAGSAVPTLNRNHIHSLPYLIPPHSCVTAYELVAIQLHVRARRNDEQAQTLATLRDTLLPRLISGQLRLPEAAIILENA